MPGDPVYVCMCVGGRVREEEGAWCRSDPVWRSNLEALYQQILKDYESSSNRLRRTSG